MSPEDLATRVTRLEERVEKLENPNGAGRLAGTTHAKKMSAKEFLLTKSVQSELQKVLALAYYLEHQEGLASFNVPDLEGVFRSAREKLPKNMNDAVNKNIARGFLMAAAEKKIQKRHGTLPRPGNALSKTI